MKPEIDTDGTIVLRPGNAPAAPAREAAASHDLAPVKYIAEIDGLRAIAVLSVLVYHVHPAWLSGGFVGVDVFFVISGYLISRLLFKDLHDGELSLAKFYTRRILRIAPALCVTLAVTALLFFTLFPPIWSRDLLISLVSAVLSFSNLWFYATVDYFANNTASPVLHTWSLAVEEQFYLLFPLILIFISRKGWMRYRVSILAGLFGASLAASVAAVDGAGQSSYFLPWLRAWELLCGALLASLPVERLSVRSRQLLGAVGVTMIVLACTRYDEATPFPGYTALLPCLGAAFVIAGSGGGGIVNFLLRTPPMRLVGQMSYSLYLVHWPLICVAGLTVNLYSDKIKGTLIATSLLLAWLSWRYVETPFRRKAGRVAEPRVFRTFGLACAALLAAFTVLKAANTQFWDRYPVARGYTEFLKLDTGYFRGGSCFVTQKSDGLSSFTQAGCLTEEAGKQSILLLGDSHAANIYDALTAQLPAAKVLQATVPGCKPLVGAGGTPTCREMMDYVFDTWLEGPGAKVKRVVLAARWEAGDVAKIEETVDRLRRAGKEVIFYGPVPEYFVAVPLMLAFMDITGIDLDRKLFRPDRLVLDRRLKVALDGKAVYYSPLDVMCEERKCTLVHDGAPVFFDRDHLTLPGARLAIKDFPLK